MQVQPTSQLSGPSQPSLGEKQCLHCGSEMRLVSVRPMRQNLIAPIWSEHVSDRCVRHVWSCEACGYEFETSVYLRTAA
jgi:transcription elongation factor Elf1